MSSSSTIGNSFIYSSNRAGRGLRHASRQDESKGHVFTSRIGCKINVFHDSLERYLEKYVPNHVGSGHSTLPLPEDTFDHTRAPEEDTSLGTRLVIGLRKLVRDFPDRKRLAFARNGANSIELPYKLCDHERHRTQPTVIASLPGKGPGSLSLPDWRNISLVFDVMPRDEDDPVGKHSRAHEETLNRLSKNARNILISQSRLFVFVVGVYGSVARIFRFDHTAAIVSEPFNYVNEPSVMQSFLWRFVHPVVDASVVVGADPTVRLPDEQDIQWAEEVLAKNDKGPLTPEERRVCRWMSIHEPGGRSVTCFAFRLRYINPHLFSRASMVWEALEEGNTDGNTIITKDSWRLLSHPSELHFYTALRASLRRVASKGNEARSGPREESAGQFGISQFIAGVDLGAVEASRLETDRTHRPTPPSSSQFDHPLDGARTHSSSVSGCHVGSSTDKQRHPSPLSHVFGHRTMSAQLRDPTSVKYYDRSHMRLAIRTVGRPISHFKSTRELVEALRDAIKGHHTAYKAGVIHRDISEGNVMITRDASSKGFIGDFDYSFNWRRFLQSHNLEVSRDSWETYVRRTYCSENGKGSRADSPPSEDIARSDTETISKTQIGTLYFMAIEILEGNAMHEARHDLESFYWLLVWLVLHHTEHDHPKGRLAGTTLFSPDYENGRSFHKRGWLLRNRPLSVPGNRPLSFLLKEYSKLCRSNCLMGPRLPVVPLTHEAVLAKFDEALACQDWPVDDAALPKPSPQPQASSSKTLGEETLPASVQDGVNGRARIDSGAHLPDRAGNITHPADQAPVQDALSTDVQSLGRHGAHVGKNGEQRQSSCHAPLGIPPQNRLSRKRARVDLDEEPLLSKRMRRTNTL